MCLRVVSLLELSRRRFSPVAAGLRLRLRPGVGRQSHFLGQPLLEANVTAGQWANVLAGERLLKALRESAGDVAVEHGRPHW